MQVTRGQLTLVGWMVCMPVCLAWQLVVVASSSSCCTSHLFQWVLPTGETSIVTACAACLERHAWTPCCRDCSCDVGVSSLCGCITSTESGLVLLGAKVLCHSLLPQLEGTCWYCCYVLSLTLLYHTSWSPDQVSAVGPSGLSSAARPARS